MSIADILAVAGASLGAFFALLSLAFSRAPGWRRLAWFAVISGTAGGFCACSLVEATTVSDSTVRAVGHVAALLSAINVYAWVRYSAVQWGGPAQRGLEVAALAIAGLALVPGVVLGDVVVRYTEAWTGAGYVDVVPTAAGAVVFLALLGIAAVPLWRFITRWRASESGAGAHALGLAGLAAASAHDAFGGALHQHWAHLVPLGLVGTVVAVGASMARRFVDSACSLELLSTRLDALVQERGDELANAQQRLAHAEKLAALGGLSGAVAHEINNPAATVASNLGYLKDALATSGTVPDDALEAIHDTLESVDRIARIVRQLGDAGDLASHGGCGPPVSLLETARAAAADTRAGGHGGVGISIDIASSLYVGAQEGSLRQVVASLIQTAATAMRQASCPGRIRVDAVRRGDLVSLRITDPCPEPDEDRRARRFAPFLSGRPTLVTRDVGLSVSSALVRIFGGDVTVERSDEEGSTVRLDLKAAECPEDRQESPGSTRTSRARVLLVDDDVLVRIGLRRLLGREYVIDEAATVEDALTCVREKSNELDAILCDLVMPDGGGGRLLQELERIAPRLARATVLLTGGAVDEATRAVLEANADRVVRKPVELEVLRALIERVRLRRSDVRELASRSDTTP